MKWTNMDELKSGMKMYKEYNLKEKVVKRKLSITSHTSVVSNGI